MLQPRPGRLLEPGRLLRGCRVGCELLDAPWCDTEGGRDGVELVAVRSGEAHGFSAQLGGALLHGARFVFELPRLPPETLRCLGDVHGHVHVTLRVHSSDLVIQTAIDRAADLGVRDVIDQAGVDKVYALLQTGEVEEATNWSRRFKDNQSKMISGDVYKVTEVVRDVWRREQDKGISAGEKSMLSRARQILVSELALAQNSTTEEADTKLLEALRTPTL